jgi:hypothetical protein
MIFTVLGAVAGKHVGRPRVGVDAARIATLPDSGASWSTITRQLGLSALLQSPNFVAVEHKIHLPQWRFGVIRTG